MASIYEQRDISPKLFTYGLFIAGLCALAYALVFQKLLIAFIIIGVPIVAIGFIYSMRYPRLGYALYATLSYYLIALIRYSRHGKKQLKLIHAFMLKYRRKCSIHKIVF